jgi:hypothetical protein
VGEFHVTAAITALLLVFVVLQTKHFICDYPLQTLWMIKNKGTYGHPGGIIHSGIHALATTTAFLILTPTLLVGLGIMAGEFLLHYHIDWGKEQIIRRAHVTATDREFWWAIGFDQLLHHLTYIAIAAVLIATVGVALR